jgi:DNA invertase Pin-like site-specific DNA recombinase
MEGIALAKRQGVYKGGTARIDRERVKQLAKDGVGPAKIARELGMARSSDYRLLGARGDLWVLSIRVSAGVSVGRS